jgi:hypothetical protein
MLMNCAAGCAIIAGLYLAASPARAADVAYYETCGPSTLSVGSYSKERDVSVSIVYDHGFWRVVHTLSNGHVYERARQYSLSDATTLAADGIYTSWTGPLNRNPAISMVGRLYMSGGVPHYSETMAKNGEIVMASDAICTFDRPPTGEARPPTAAPVGSPFSVAVATANEAGVYGIQTVGVTLASTYTSMEIDTGCSTMQITKTMADSLVARGEAVEARSGQSLLADGSTHADRRVIINSASIGGKVITNVLSAVGDDNAAMLLGIGALQRFGKFSINPSAHQLVLG